MLLGDVLVAHGYVRREDVSEAMERQVRVGGRLGENLLALGHLTPEHLEQATDVLADMLRNSTLIDSEIERERGVILEELAAVEDSPMEQVGVLLDQQLWTGQPHGRDVAGTVESVSKMPNPRILDYYRRQYVPNATVVSLAGAISIEAALDLAQRHFGLHAQQVFACHRVHR